MKAPTAGSFFRGDLKDQATDIAQELAARVLKIVGLTIEIVAVRIDHPGEAQRLVSECEQADEATQQAALEAGVFWEIVAAAHAVAQIHAAEEVMVLHGRRTLFRTELQVLQIGFNERSAALQHF